MGIVKRIDTCCCGFLLRSLSCFFVILTQLRYFITPIVIIVLEKIKWLGVGIAQYVNPIVVIVYEKIRWLGAGITQVSLDVLV